MSAKIRPARVEDAATVVALIRELAAYEKLEQHAQATAADIERHLFGPHPVAGAFMAEVDGEAVGFAVYFTTFSTFRGQPGLYLEDIFVRPAHRGRGLGRALFRALAKLAVDRGYGRLDWVVLDWNAPAIGFYRALGAVAMDDWTVNRLEGDALARLAAQGGNAGAIDG